MTSKQGFNNFTKSEPEAEATSLNPSSQSVGEPVPEWHTAVRKWGLAWKFYQYGLGAAFGILMLWSATILLKSLIRKNRPRRPKKASLVVLILLFIFGLSRCLYMTIDAYNTKGILPENFTNVLWSLGNPCIITAYILIFLVLKNTFILRERFQIWYTPRNITFISVSYFSLVLVTELVLFYLPSFKGVTFACQMMYVLLSLMLSFFYSFVAYLLWKNCKGANIHGRNQSRNQFTAWTDVNSNCGRRTRSVLKTCIAAIFGGVALGALQIYSMSSVYGVFSNAKNVPAWPWLILNYAMRVLELFLSSVLFLASARGTGSQQRSFYVGLGFVASRVRRRSRVVSITQSVVANDGLRRESTIV